MLRWFIRLSNFDFVNFEKKTIEDRDDTLYACFQNIFCLRDWIILDGDINPVLAHRFVDSNIEMKICRDIANGTKHHSLKDSSMKQEITVNREIRRYEKGHSHYQVTFEVDGHFYEAKELAENCIKLWDEFISAQPKPADSSTDALIISKALFNFCNMPVR
ncbi:MAG: hypothetical protein C5B59_16190 [Bacteroidetes bacterium]|nr:MAG: hypothetical protein C5B59_16190 [Bacteroidota bacterium]